MAPFVREAARALFTMVSLVLLSACAASNDRPPTDVEIPLASAAPSDGALDRAAPAPVRHASAPLPSKAPAPSARASFGASNPNAASAEALFEEGKQLAAQGKMMEAARKLEASASLDPAAGTFLNLAKCREQLGDVPGACVSLRNALPLVTAGDARGRFIHTWGMRLGCGLP